MTKQDEQAAGVGSSAVQSIHEVDPQFVRVDDLLSGLRDRTTARYKASVEGLAKRIGEAGQDSPCVVREDADGYVLIAGQRRKEAVEMLRAQGEDILLRVIVNDTVSSYQDNHHLACRENFDREQFTPIEKAKIIRGLRLDNEWQGAKFTDQISAYLGIESTTVTQLERLLKLPAELQDRIESGSLSVSSALELAGVRPEKLAQVTDKAIEKAAVSAVEAEERKAEGKAAGKTAGKAGKTKGKKDKIPNPKPDVPMLNEKQLQAAREKAVEKARAKEAKIEEKKQQIRAGAKDAPKIEEKHVRAAAREVEGAVDKQKAPKLGELLEVVAGWVQPVYPKVMQQLAAELVGFGHGKRTLQQLQAGWEDLADAYVPQAVKDVKEAIAKTTLMKPNKIVVRVSPPATKHKAKPNAKHTATWKNGKATGRKTVVKNKGAAKSAKGKR